VAVQRVPTRAVQRDASYLPPGLLHPSAAVVVTLSEPPGRLPTPTKLRKRLGLTRRQAEVALLLARRLSNREIAERLVISPHTALRHTEAVMAKLNIRDRRLVEDRLREARGD
jgi:DNA-binding CsgD family transcriptional regulator